MWGDRSPPTTPATASGGFSPTGVVVLDGHSAGAADGLAAGLTGHADRRTLAGSLRNRRRTELDREALAARYVGDVSGHLLDRSRQHRLVERGGVAIGIGQIEVRPHRVVTDENVLRYGARHRRRVVLLLRRGERDCRLAAAARDPLLHTVHVEDRGGLDRVGVVRSVAVGLAHRCGVGVG